MDTSSVPGREPEASVDPRFVTRWSPRAFEERPVPADDVASLFEAARWAPSCFNEQPWVFVYGAKPDDEAGRDKIYDLLVEANQAWAKRAPLLGIVFAKRRFSSNDKDNRSAEFDCGLASMSLILQAQELGLVVHFMAGFDSDAAPEALGLDDDDYKAMAAFAVGYQADKEILSEELQEREKPSDRKPLAEVARPAGDGK